MSEKEYSYGKLLPVNPLMDSVIMTTEEEGKQKLELIKKASTLSEMNKQVLEGKRRQVELMVDHKKLDSALKIVDGIDDIATVVLDPAKIAQVMSKPDLTPQDFKYMVESVDKLSNTLKNLMNPAVNQEFGDGHRSKYKIMANFKPSGEVNVGVSVDD